MNRKELQDRTKKFHIDVMRLCESFPRTTAGWETAKQLIRSAGSVGANYRTSAGAKSKRDFIHKIETVLEEADESLYWLEIANAYLTNSPGVERARLIAEANELTAIFAATDRTSKQRYTKPKS